MSKARLFVSISLALLIVLSIGLTSADLLVAGTVYDTSIGNPVSGIGVTVNCDGNIQTATSLSDGAYSVLFSGVSSCSSLNVSSIADNATIINISNDFSSPTTTTTPTYGGGGGGGSSPTNYLQCSSWDNCTNGLENRSCWTTNGMFYNNTQTQACISNNTVVPLNTTILNTSSEETPSLNSTTTTAPKAGITGGVIDALGSPAGISIIGFLVLMLIAALILISRKKNKASNN
jgi:hypothetical protein